MHRATVGPVRPGWQRLAANARTNPGKRNLFDREGFPIDGRRFTHPGENLLPLQFAML
jgi:hypothetical protein